jgi:succinoglycan biosynthesis protein ExoA
MLDNGNAAGTSFDAASAPLGAGGGRTPVASVLTPVRNEERYIRDAVARMQAQEIDGDIELLFMDGRSSDNTRAILEEIAATDPRIRIFDNPGRTTPKGLNIGLRHARGEFIVRMDAHTHYPGNYVAAGVERLRRGGVVWVNGPQVPTGRGPWSARVALATQSWLGIGGATFRRGAGTEIETDTGFTGMWSRADLDRLGGWDDEWTINQDAELAARIRASGGRIVCIPEMAAEYIPRDSLKMLARQYYRYGFYRAKTARRHPLSLRRTHVLAPGVAASVIGSVVLPEPLRTPARLGLASYAVATIVASASIGARQDARLRDAAALPAVFATMHLGWGAGFLAGCLRFGPPLAGLARLAGLSGGETHPGSGPSPVTVAGPPQASADAATAAARYGAPAAGGEASGRLPTQPEVAR